MNIKKAWWFMGGGGNPAGSFLYNSSSDYFVSSAASLLNDEIKGTTQKFSISIWTKLVTAPTSLEYQTLFSRDNNTGGRQFAVEWRLSGKMSFYIFDSPTKFTYWETNLMTVNTSLWQHITVTFDNNLALASKCKIYINGNEETLTRVDTGGGVSNVKDEAAEPLYIGITNFGSLVNPVKGYISAISFWTDILTGADVTTLWNSGSYRDEKVAPTSIAAFMQWNPSQATFSSSWTMGDSIGTTYGVSKNFTSNNIAVGDRSLSVVPDGTFTYQTETNTVVAAMSSSPGLRDKYIIDTTIESLKLDGAWTELDTIWFMAAHDQQAGRLNWKAPASYTLTEQGTPTWTLGRGYTGNGSTRYLRTGFILSSSGVKYVLNSGSFGVYLRSNLNEATVAMGSISGSDATLMLPRNAGNMIGRVNAAANDGPYAVADSLGLSVVRRTASNVHTYFKNGVTPGNTTLASSAIPTVEVYIMAYNSAGTPTLPSNNEFSIAFIGSGAVDQVKLYRVLNGYMSSKGFNV